MLLTRWLSLVNFSYKYCVSGRFISNQVDMKTQINTTHMLNKAIEIAEKAFKDKKDKGGCPYRDHLNRVAWSLLDEGYNVMTIAWLHDLIEDCEEWNEARLLEYFDKEIVDCVMLLTHKKKDSYEAYIDKILKDWDAVKVKMADLKDNMNITRLPVIEENDLKRLVKYHAAYKLLEASL